MPIAEALRRGSNSPSIILVRMSKAMPTVGECRRASVTPSGSGARERALTRS
ncbi:hypothetical protein [Corynebacterium matruchotii]|nr:hypothetical protein [Corynebacterium matruchotii]